MGIGIVLVTRHAEHGLLRHVVLDGLPVGLTGINIFNRLQCTGNRAGTTPNLKEEGRRVGIEKLLLDEL